MPKCDFNKAAKQFYWNHTSACVFSCKFATYFQNTFFIRTPLDNGCSISRNLGRTEVNLVTSNNLYFSYFYQTIYVKTKVNFVLFILLETRLTKLKWQGSLMCFTFFTLSAIDENRNFTFKRFKGTLNCTPKHLLRVSEMCDYHMPVYFIWRSPNLCCNNDFIK